MENPQITIVSSLEKTLLNSTSALKSIENINLFQNEAAAFQIVFECDNHKFMGDCYAEVKIVSSLKDHISLFTVGHVQCQYAAAQNADSDYITKKPDILPDLLVPYIKCSLRVRPGIRQSIWAEVFNPNGLTPGKHEIKIILTNCKGEEYCTKTICATVYPEFLPQMYMPNTQWFYCDCLCDYYNLEMFSDEFFEVARNYARFAVEHGINMLLTPVFTPSLDVEAGQSRRKSQLVDVFVNSGEYSFDFALLKRWIKVFSDCGIKYFEIGHFFTQWGSKFAVEVYASVDNKECEKIFGWNTPSNSPQYADFLAQFLPALVHVLKECGVNQNTYFHISDEPSKEQIEAYRSAYNMVVPYVEGCQIIDALSDYAFYKEGLVPCPVVAIDHIQAFYKHKVPQLWAYYCCVQGNKVPNRFIAMPSRRNRILGVLLYVYNIKGFLQWGYNYWYSQFSKSLIDPYTVTDAGLGFPSGDAFLVYPGKNKEPVASIRAKVMREALQDMQALRLLESLTSRENVLNLIESEWGKITFKKYPRTDNAIIKLRNKIDEDILKFL